MIDVIFPKIVELHTLNGLGSLVERLQVILYSISIQLCHRSNDLVGAILIYESNPTMIPTPN